MAAVAAAAGASRAALRAPAVERLAAAAALDQRQRQISAVAVVAALRLAHR